MTEYIVRGIFFVSYGNRMQSFLILKIISAFDSQNNSGALNMNINHSNIVSANSSIHRKEISNDAHDLLHSLRTMLQKIFRSSDNILDLALNSQFSSLYRPRTTGTTLLAWKTARLVSLEWICQSSTIHHRYNDFQSISAWMIMTFNRWRILTSFRSSSMKIKTKSESLLLATYRWLYPNDYDISS